MVKNIPGEQAKKWPEKKKEKESEIREAAEQMAICFALIGEEKTHSLITMYNNYL